MTDRKLAVVTGGNRGIGFAVSRGLAKKGLHVVLTARDEKKGRDAASKLEKEGLSVSFEKLDVTSGENIRAFRERLEREYGRVDVLVNNAGVFLDTEENRTGKDATVLNARPETVRDSLETNVFGPLILSQQLVPLMRKNRYGRIVNVSSGMGQLSEMNGGYPGYRISKTALNAVTRIFSDEFKDDNILVNSVCPGWVKTEMGGEEAERTPEEGADTIIWAATLPDSGPTGTFFRDRHPIPW